MRLKVKTMVTAGTLLLGLLITGCSQGVPPIGTNPTSASPVASTPVATTQDNVVKSGATGELIVEGQKTQSHQANNVTIEATPQGNLATGGKDLVFDVVLDTHSVDLDKYDLVALTVLRDSQGREFKPVSWNAPKGGHHRSGLLTFSADQPISQAGIKYVELSVRDIASASHLLRWELWSSSS